MMAGIRGRDTQPEMMIRKGLHRLGFRYRLHDRRLLGRPDLVFPKHRATLFVNGCFWHGHNCHLFRMPGSRRAFWEAKIAANQARDARDGESLAQSGWRIGTVWECALKGRTRLPVETILAAVAAWITGNADQFEIRGTDA